MVATERKEALPLPAWVRALACSAAAVCLQCAECDGLVLRPLGRTLPLRCPWCGEGS